MFTNDALPVPYHQQDVNYYCGAAAAQMVLRFVGEPLADQYNLFWNKIDPNTVMEPTGWFSGPDGLEWALVDGDSSARGFTLHALESEGALSRQMVWSIHHDRVPAVALVRGFEHWMVVRGYTATAVPRSATDTSYSIINFDVRDPEPPAVNRVVPSHGPTDGCGSGQDRGVADQTIGYQAWQSDYMTGVTAGFWEGKFLAVAGPLSRPEPPAGLRVVQAHTLPVAKRQLPSSAGPIKPKAAIERVRAGLQAQGLTTRTNYSQVLKRARPGTPLLVRRLDRLHSFYYIVPMQDKGGVALLVLVDATTGDFQRSAIRTGNSGSVFSILTVREAKAKVVGRRFTLPNKEGYLTVPKRLPAPTLVWRPCLESQSPLLPFYQFIVDARQIYVRGDGEVFMELQDGNGK